jgi:hypothetical protein
MEIEWGYNRDLSPTNCEFESVWKCDYSSIDFPDETATWFFYPQIFQIGVGRTNQDWLVVEPPLWKIWKSIGRIIPYIMENKKCSKPPTSIYIYVHFGSIRCIWCMYNIYIYTYIYIHIYIHIYIYAHIYIISINYGIAMNSPYSLRLTTFHRPQGARSEIITPDLPLVAPLAKSARKPTYPALAPWNLIPTWSCIPGSQAWFKWLCRVIS